MKKETKIEKILAGKGFYIVLACCLIAIGIAGVSVFNLPKTPEKPEENEEYLSYESPTPPYNDNNSHVSEENPPESAYEPEESETVTVNEEKEDEPYFVMPVTGEVIKKYSETELIYSETYHDMRIHSGIDIKPSGNTAVCSASKGKVTAIDENTAYGNTVTVDHGNGIFFRYCGLNNITVSEGDNLSAGDVLGQIGTVNCECSDEAHLHLEAFKDSIPVSPSKLLGLGY